MFNSDDIFDMAQALYWYCNDYHTGQFSDTYRVLCEISETYKPGVMENGCNDDSVAMIYYMDLETGVSSPTDMLDFINENVGK
jgi:hypothetical protein